jgi:hypothetical protein
MFDASVQEVYLRVQGESRRLHIGYVHDRYSMTNIMLVVKLRRIR